MSINTMTTSPNTDNFLSPEFGVTTGWPQGLPDPTVLARLANEFLRALPGQDVPEVAKSERGIADAAAPEIAASASPAGQISRPALPTRADEPLYFLRDSGSYKTVATPVNPLPPPSDPSFGFAAPLPLAKDPTPQRIPAQEAGLYFLGESRSFAAQPEVPAEEPSREANAAEHTSAHPALDAYAIRRDFPILEERVHGRRLVWLDNGATTQKPQSVIDRLSYFYAHENSNIHRAAHELAARATDAYEAARQKVARFLNASSPDEIVFVRGTTEAINLVAQSWGRRHIVEGDEIVISWLEHHANIVPWQQLCTETGARLRVAPVDDTGQIKLDEYEKLFNARTKLAAFSHVSNALGTITPVREMVDIAHRHGALALVDGAQAVSHLRVDVQALDCDWYVFSGHKVFGPTGIGAVYGRLDLLNATPPWQGGGNMIQDVTFERTIYQPAPARFEAGTGNIADAVGLGAALDYVEKIGIDNVTRYEHDLLQYATHALYTVPGLCIIGTATEKAGVLSFVLEGFRTEDIGKALNQEGIAVRAGHHCAQPILRRFGLEATVRASLAFYNTCDDIDALVAALLKIRGGGSGLQH